MAARNVFAAQVATVIRVDSSERQGLQRFRESLYDWHFSDLKKAASPEVGLPRLAFIGLASWIDAVARLYAGRKGDGFSAWRAFIREYLPKRMHDERDVRRLYDGLRNAMSHEYGTRDVLLTNADPRLHWTLRGGARILDLAALLDDFERAFEKFYGDLEAKPDLRARVLPHAEALLAPVIVEAPPGFGPDGTITLVAASATGPYAALDTGSDS